MLITYTNYKRMKQDLLNRYGTFEDYPTDKNFINRLIKYGVVTTNHKQTAVYNCHKKEFYDYVIFLHFYTKYNVSFENSNGCKFKLDTAANRRLLWK